MQTETEIFTAPVTEPEAPPVAVGAGRPRIELDTEQIKKLAEIQCTVKEIAYIMGVSTDTITRNYQDAVDTGKETGKMLLRRAQWRKAVEDGNPGMLTWLGRQYLGQSESPINSQDSQILPWQD